MKTCTYNDCLNDFIALAGLEAAPEDFIKRRFNLWFNIRLREIWRAHRWSFLIRTVPIAVCSNHWSDLPLDIENGDIFEVFNSDFRINKNAKRVRFYIENGASIICEDLKQSKLSFPPWQNDFNYQAGDVYEKNGDAFFVSKRGVIKLTKELYSQNYVNNYGQSVLKKGDIVVFCEGVLYGTSVFNGSDFESIPSDIIGREAVIRYKAINPEFKECECAKALPYAFKSFIGEATRANWLSAENRPEEAAMAETRAKDFLEEEVLRDSQNPYSSTPVNFR